MRTRSLVSLLVTAHLASAPAPAMAETVYPETLAKQEGAVRLEPLTPWNIDFGENRCRLTRMFGSAEDRHLLMFEQAAPGRYFGLTLAGRSIERFKTATKVGLGLERDEPMLEIERFGHGTVADFGSAVIISALALNETPPEGALRAASVDLDAAATIDRIVLQRGKLVVSLETGNLKDALAALNTCSADLLAQWGLDPVEHQNYVPAFWNNSETVIARIKATYPRVAERRGEQAIIRLRVIVEHDGSVSNCLIDESTIAVTLESPACKEMQRATFNPARNARGEPMRSFYSTTITYALS